MTAKRASHVVLTNQIPSGGRSFVIELDAAERRTLADTIGITEVTELRSDLDVRPLGGDAYGVKGTLTATVVQTDVVTLEPLTQAVREEIDLSLVPAEDTREARPSVELGAPDRDTYTNGRIDLDAIVAEHLALGLDPYPRAAGVEFPGHVEDAAGKASPFAVLAPLKKPE
jgi:uncharacterized metal-binding protein YceD (DUF177 family)